uniref:Small nuclear ribonucleoprotein G n=1 Tax=Salmo trutta TaxID=8032 RepID=A0A673YUI2_SALTR
MSKAHPPELKKFMDKKLSLKLNGGRQVQGVLRGFDPFMNLVMDDCLEMAPGGIQNTIGMVVSTKRRCQLHLHTISEDRHIFNSIHQCHHTF